MNTLTNIEIYPYYLIIIEFNDVNGQPDNEKFDLVYTMNVWTFEEFINPETTPVQSFNDEETLFVIAITIRNELPTFFK